MLFLDKSEKNEITSSYEEIEKIIGQPLPRTAYNNKAWWNNDDVTHTQSAAWSDVGYKTCKIDLGESVSFIKDEK